MTKRYVDTKIGSDSNPGTDSRPFLTLQAASNALVDGDEIIIQEGVYKDTVQFIGRSDIKITGVGNVIIYGGSPLLGTKWTPYTTDVWVRDMPGDPIALLTYDAAGKITKGWRMDAIAEVNAATKFFYDTGTNKLYYWSKTDPSYIRIDYTARTGTVSVHGGTCGVHTWSCTRFTFSNVKIYGWYGNGLVADVCNEFVSDERFECAYNTEDGCGGFGQTGWVFNKGVFSWNGTRRARNQAEIWTDGDGISFHDTLDVSAIPSTGIYMLECYGEGNTKDFFQHIHYSDDIVADGCVIVNSNFNIIINAAGGHQTVRNCEVRATIDDIGGIGFNTAGTCDVYNNTFIGPSTTTGTGVAVNALVGTINFKNNIVTNWRYEYTTFAATFTSRSNSLGGNGTAANQMPLGTGDNRTDAKVTLTAKGTYEIGSKSAAAYSGLDLTAEGFTKDARGRTRKVGAWSRGAYEPTVGPRAIIIQDPTEFFELVYGL